MPDNVPRRAIVFDRIEANRRKTILLSIVCGLALIPVLAWLSSYLAFWVVLFLPGLAEFMGDARIGISAYFVLVAVIASGLVTAALYLQYRYADRIALRMARARPLGRDREKRLWDTVEGLCLGTGLPLPKLYLVETEVPIAFSVGLDPERSSLVVTRGLLSLLNPGELAGVMAHEISHIGNQDIRLNTMVAAMGTVLRLPFRVLTAPFRFLFHVHWLLGAGALLLCTPLIAWLPDFAGSLRTFDEMDPTGELRTILLIQGGAVFHAFLVAPVIGLLFPLAVSRGRELLADADAARLTLDPPSLARALSKISRGGYGPMMGSHALSHMYISELPGTALWWKGMFSAHPPVRERIELLAGMGDGILPEPRGEKEAVGQKASRDAPVAPSMPARDIAAPAGEPGFGFFDASLYGFAVGAVVVAILAVANCAFLLLRTGAHPHLGMIMPFSPAAALAAGFSARKRGMAMPIALGFAVLVFLFHWPFLVPLIPLMPDPDRSPDLWIVWSLASELAVVAVTAIAGASLDRWATWAKTLLDRWLGRIR